MLTVTELNRHRLLIDKKFTEGLNRAERKELHALENKAFDQSITPDFDKAFKSVFGECA